MRCWGVGGGGLGCVFWVEVFGWRVMSGVFFKKYHTIAAEISGVKIEQVGPRWGGGVVSLYKPLQ